MQVNRYQIAQVSLPVVTLVLLVTVMLLRQQTDAPQLPILETLGGDFTLQNTRGVSRHLSDYGNRVVMLNFGYLSCPDICPTVLSRMRDVAMAVDDDALQGVFVTLDPSRDDIGSLDVYVRHFYEGFEALTGTQDEIDRVLSLYKVQIEKVPGVSTDQYLIDHNTHIYLLDGQGRTRQTFGRNVTVTEMVTAVQSLLTKRDSGQLP